MVPGHHEAPTSIPRRCTRKPPSSSATVPPFSAVPSGVIEPLQPSGPSWPACSHDGDPSGCRGRAVEPRSLCLAHLAAVDRDAYLASLAPGADIDHRGTVFSGDLLVRLLAAVHDPTVNRPRLGTARFNYATFECPGDFLSATFEKADFQHATFEDFTRFSNAIFEGNAFFGRAAFRNGLELEGVIFHRAARFDHTVFDGYIDFHSAQFNSAASFDSATFQEVRFEHATFEQTATFDLATLHDVDFEYVTFKKTAYFEQTTFGNTAQFAETEFKEDARFSRATFARVTTLGPFLCRGEVTLSGAVFESPVVLMAVARRLVCHGTRWASTAALRLRYATVDFAHAAIEYPLSISTESSPLAHDGDWIDWLLDDPLATRPDAPDSSGVAISSLHGVDTAHLVLTDVDVASCVFTGAVHLDQLRLDGACTFNRVPTGIHWQRWRPVRFTRRRTLGEEHHWRARQPHAAAGWDGSTAGSDTLGPTQLAPVYRALRKAFEDSKNEPGAADFYYGEMAMRQRDPTTPPTERGLLAAYWALSGYGLRASRAFGWLLAAMTITVLAMMVWGIPRDDPNPASTGTVTGQNIRLVTETPDPVNPTGAELSRLTSDRFEKSLRVVINSVIFRSSGQDLTTAGTYVEMASRLTEPVLLGLGILALRGRVKR